MCSSDLPPKSFLSLGTTTATTAALTFSDIVAARGANIYPTSVLPTSTVTLVGGHAYYLTYTFVVDLSETTDDTTTTTTTTTTPSFTVALLVNGTAQTYGGAEVSGTGTQTVTATAVVKVPFYTTSVVSLGLTTVETVDLSSATLTVIEL